MSVLYLYLYLSSDAGLACLSWETHSIWAKPAPAIFRGQFRNAGNPLSSSLPSLQSDVVLSFFPGNHHLAVS